MTGRQCRTCRSRSGGRQKNEKTCRLVRIVGIAPTCSDDYLVGTIAFYAVDQTAEGFEPVTKKMLSKCSAF